MFCGFKTCDDSQDPVLFEDTMASLLKKAAQKVVKLAHGTVLSICHFNYIVKVFEYKI